MTISHSNLRRTVSYAEIEADAISAVEPDSIGFSLTIAGEAEALVLECLASGAKNLVIYDTDRQRIVVDQGGGEFSSWSEGLKLKVAELLHELTDWETNLRKVRGAWDIRLLADADITFDDLVTREELT